MTTSDLENKLGVTSRWIRAKTKKALEQGVDSIKIDNASFRFKLVRGSYIYEELKTIIDLNIKETDSSKVWRLASESKKSEALLKERLVRDYRNRKSGESWKKFLKRVSIRYRKIEPTKSKLFRWAKIVKDCEDRGLVAVEYLLDTRGKSSSNRTYTDEHIKYMETLIFEKPDIEAVQVKRYMENDFGKNNTPHYATIVRMMAKWKEQHRLVYAVAKNPSEAIAKYRPAPARADSEIHHTNQLWELDATPADIICSDGVRYTISGMIDVFSRRVCVVVEPTNSYTALGKMLRKSILKFGLPEVVLTDQGKEYTSNSFQYTCFRLGIEQQLTPPYSGYLKPHIERFFGTMTRGLFSYLDGYIGSNVAEREEISNRQTFAKKQESIRKWRNRYKSGDEFAKRFAVKKENVGIDIELPVTKQELEQMIEQWITWYETRLHRGINEKPIDKWNSCSVPRSYIADERVLDILVGDSVKKKIQKKGITWKKITYWNDLFYDKVGESVWILSDDDLGHIFVYDLDMNFICEAVNYAMLNRSREEHEAGMRFEASLAKKQKRIDEARANKPNRIKRLLDKNTKDKEVSKDIDIGMAHKNKSIDGVIDAVIETSKLEELKSDKDDVVVVNGRPMFTSLFSRFMWDFENNMIDDSTKKLAEKKPRVYEMALEEWNSKKAG